MIGEVRSVIERSEPNPETVIISKPEEQHMKEKSIFKGVFKCGKKFKAQIQTNRVQHYLGLFDTEIEAAKAYDNHARVVLGPKARTNFEYSTNTPSEPVVLVAPLFVRQDGRSAAPVDDAGAAPKRSYVGIKMKRRENGDKKPRLSDELDGHHTSYMQQYGGGPFGHLGGLSSLDHQKSMGNMTEDQYRWFEQFQQMQQMQQHQQFMMQFGAGLPPGQFNPFASPSFLSGLPSDPYASQFPTNGMSPSQYAYEAYMHAQQGAGAFSKATIGGSFAMPGARLMDYPGTGTGASSGYGRGGIVPALTSNPYGFPTSGGGVPLPTVSHSGANKAVFPRVRDLPRDESTLAAAAQLGQLMALNPQSLLGESSSAEKAVSEADTRVEHKAVSPLSNSGSLSRRNSVTTDEGSREAAECVSSSSSNDSGDVVDNGAYKFAGKPLPLPVVSSSAFAEPTLAAASLAAQYQADAAQKTSRAASTVAANTNTVEKTTSLQDDDEEEEELDWRDQLYYWTGLLYFDPARAVQVWKGSWVGSYSGKPMPEEFSWSFNHFEYTADGGRATPIMTADGMLLPQSGPMQGYYLMDNDGSGALQRYVDTEYVVDFEALPNLVGGGLSELFAVYGRGDSDFGEFIVTGNYNKRTRILDMTRQYIAETDPRSRMPLAQLKQLMRMQR